MVDFKTCSENFLNSQRVRHTLEKFRLRSLIANPNRSGPLQISKRALEANNSPSRSMSIQYSLANRHVMSTVPTCLGSNTYLWRFAAGRGKGSSLVKQVS